VKIFRNRRFDAPEYKDTPGRRDRIIPLYGSSEKEPSLSYKDSFLLSLLS
jgi:hypothetical protein